jgi:Predicted membrane protein
MLKYAEHPSTVLRITLDSGLRRNTMEGFDNEIPHDSGSGPFFFKHSILRNSLCQEKEQDIQREIGYAEKHNNQHRVDGLKKALSEVKANCSDSKLRADHQKKIAEQKDEIAERRRDLQEAKEKGDAEKIAKREKKLKEAQDDLKALEARDY